MKGRVFIIHRWDGTPEADWLPWLRFEFESRGFDVEVPAMPDTEHPAIDVWVSHLANLAGIPDAHTYFVGHSVGCQAILRYLETTGDSVKIGGAVFVAGWFTLAGLETEEEREIIKPWIETSIDFGAIRGKIKSLTAIFSDNDPYVTRENRELFKQELGARIIVERRKGHFTEDDGVRELPVARDALLDMAGE